MTSKAEQQQNKATPVYIRSADNSWVPVLQVKPSANGKATISRPIYKDEQQMLHCGQGVKLKFNKQHETIDLSKYQNNILPLQNVDGNGNLEDYKDMVELPFMHEVRWGLQTD